MNQKLFNALKTAYGKGSKLGLDDEAIGKAAALGLADMSDEQIAAFVTAAEPILKPVQSAADKVRTELHAKIKELEGEKAKLEAKLNNGNQNPPKADPETKPADNEKIPAWAQALIDSNKTLSDKLAGFEATKAKEAAVSALDKFVSEWDYAKGFPKEAAEAKRIAMKLYAKGGESMTAEELIAEFRGEFDPAVKAKGVTDFTKPFESDGGGSRSEAEKNAAFADEIRNALGMNKE